MVMKNEKGITLVELLVAVVIAGIIIVPLLTIMTGTFTRTNSQEKETEIAYVAQEVMEKVRQNQTSELQISGCWTNIASISGCGSLDVIDIETAEEIYVEAIVKPYADNVEFNEVEIIVKSLEKEATGPNGGVENKEKNIELVTVVKK